MGSKSKLRFMNSNKTIKKGSETKKSKKENAPDIISKSLLKLVRLRVLKIQKFFSVKILADILKVGVPIHAPY